MELTVALQIKNNVMKNPLKFTTKICAYLLGLLGFAAIFTACAKYGMPVRTIEGKVSDKITGSPISGIKVTNRPFYEDSIMEGMSVMTNPDGSYKLFDFEAPYLEFKDIDGDENGRYRDTVVEIGDKNKLDVKLTPKE
jgi:putative lipoprotein (rSAM/lipoprotein system)